MALAASNAAVCEIAIARQAGGVAMPAAVTNSPARMFHSVAASARAFGATIAMTTTIAAKTSFDLAGRERFMAVSSVDPMDAKVRRRCNTQYG